MDSELKGTLRDDLPIRRVLISAVENDSGIVEFAKKLAERKVEIIATSETLDLLTKASVPAKPLTDITKLPSLLDGRLRTAQPEVLLGVLADKSNPDHLGQLRQYKIEGIDIVVCNFLISSNDAGREVVDHRELAKNIDSLCLIGAAATNYPSTCVVTEPAFYNSIIIEMDRNKGGLPHQVRKILAERALGLVEKSWQIIRSRIQADGKAKEPVNEPSSKISCLHGLSNRQKLAI